MLLPLLAAVASAQAVPCPDLTALSAEIHAAIDSVELEEAQKHAGSLMATLDCQATPVSPLALHAALVTAGAAHHFQGEDDGATKRFTWAAAVAPTSMPDPALGQDVADLYRAARSEALAQAPAGLVVGLGPMWVDGTARDTNTRVTVAPGPHFVQWTTESGELVNRRFELASGEQLHLAGGVLPAPVPTAVPTSPAPRSTSKARTARAPAARWMRVGGAVGMLAGSGFLVASAQAHQQFDQTQGRTELVSLQQTVNGRTLIGASSAAVGGTLFVSSWSPRLHTRSTP